MANFKELLNKTNDGIFTYGTEKVEIHVNYADCSIRVEYFKSSNHFLNPIKVETYYTLWGMFGSLTVEQQFNKIISEL